MAFELLSKVKVFGGFLHRVKHASAVTGCDMTFAIFTPSQAETAKVPALMYLSGLTCTDKNVTEKGSFASAAAAEGIAFIAPDTSPRGVDLGDFDDSGWDIGTGAGFYLTATQEPFAGKFNMYDYVTKELPELVAANFPVDMSNVSITGHSMGGHGALTLALKNPGMYKSCSAFAPICNPMECPWGDKAFTTYIGADKAAWAEYDATVLVNSYAGPDLNLLIDQGVEDNFYSGKQLLPENFAAACAANSVPLTLRMQDGYDHSYWFISSFLDEHIRHHAKFLKA